MAGTRRKSPKARPLAVTDTTLRDGHQSILATRMRTGDMIALAEMMDEVGFQSMEVWGGATFDVATRFLNEDPWERLAELKRRLRRTPLQMLLRGQNLVGYRHYADDVVDAFVDRAAETGIDIFRVFDALNDERNFEASFRAIKRTGKHIQAAVSYSITGKRLGGEVFDLDYYVGKAKIFEEMGADSFCIKDMAGLLNPFDADILVGALKDAIDIPVQLHCHFTSGMASMSYLKGIEAGADGIDCALAPFGFRSSEPAIEPFVAALAGSDRDPELDLEKIIAIDKELEKRAGKYRCFLNETRMAIIDTGVLEHQIPGGMLSNLVSQLREADALDRIDEVYEEIPRTRAELGFPPLVTPTSQIVGTQAVQNVLFGRYAMVSAQVKDYVFGLYGRSPVPIDQKLRKKILKGYPRGSKPIDHRAADLLEPELDAAREAVADITTDERDVLIYALYPTTGMRFLRWKHGLEKPTAEEMPREEPKPSGDGLDAADASAAERKKGGGRASRTFRVQVAGDEYEIEVEEVLSRPRMKSVSDTAPIVTRERKKRDDAGAAADEKAPAGEISVIAPMPGLVLEYKVREGDAVEVGDVLLVLEAMKMQNSLTSNHAGVIRSLKVAPGTSVEKNQVILTLST
ncbi:MAG: pyruvate carboxylase subunit B [Candidatus Krumholzibacteriota bacterium]|nr:pyruvate carboxylase subunit B [Candidatus Krumholzibacteriota bacterium]